MTYPPSTTYPTIAYFSMEIGLEPSIPTYSGGLGVLAGDTLRAAADYGLPMVAVTLAHRKGYFHQRIDPRGVQQETPHVWWPEQRLQEAASRVRVRIEGRDVTIRAWRYEVRGARGNAIPVLLLDTQLPENSVWDQALTDQLYGGDLRYRLCQEVVLGYGGIAMLRELGYSGAQVYHMTEGHSALLALALLEARLNGQGLSTATKQDREAVRRCCVFTTHTPVPAGHDQFPASLVSQALGQDRASALKAQGDMPQDVLNLTRLALGFSRYVNAVSMRHEEVSRAMFPGQMIDAITNGVHAPTWAAQPIAELFDRYIPEWRHDNRYLRYAISIPVQELYRAHKQAKRDLLAEVERRTGTRFEPSRLTIGFARRSTPYKRADLLFIDPARLRRIAQAAGPIQVVYGGKAHPNDEGGKALIRHIYEVAAELREVIPIVYVEDYDMTMGRMICSGVDVWLNTPKKPLEASGTSGMKAALNGVPSLSVLDGWWVEGCVEGVTGWAIGGSWDLSGAEDTTESDSLYEKLEHVIVPMFYDRPQAWATIMRSAIAMNGSYFNAQRMVSQYLENAYMTSGE
ncbi:MAG: alpha-glucan family phosphorylase [Chloroflexi bacterium]|nr:alpha-glucan family phosphorylase [Chloroflexota bacterium]